MNKGIIGAVVCLLCSMPLSQAWAQDDKPAPTKVQKTPKVTWLFDYHMFDYNQIGQPLQSISNIPLSQRQIPGHPDDPWRGLIFTVPDKQFPVVGLKTLGAFYNFATGLAFYNRVGVNLNFEFLHTSFQSAIKSPAQLDGPPETSPYINEINQFGVNERGFGTSLVYYYIRFDERNWAYVWPELEVRLIGGLSVLGGKRQYDYDYKVGQGYDRFDKFTDLQEVQLGSVSADIPYIGIRFEQDVDEGDDRLRGGIIVRYGFPRTSFQAQFPGIVAPWQRSRYISVTASIRIPMFKK